MTTGTTEPTLPPQVTTKGIKVLYVPPPSWKDGQAGTAGVIYSEPAMDTDGNWSVLVLFAGEIQFRGVGISYLEIVK